MTDTQTTRGTQALDVDEAARRLDVSPYLIRRMVADGSLRSVRLGRLIRIPAAALDRLLSGEPRP